MTHAQQPNIQQDGQHPDHGQVRHEVEESLGEQRGGNRSACAHVPIPIGEYPKAKDLWVEVEDDDCHASADDFCNGFTHLDQAGGRDIEQRTRVPFLFIGYSFEIHLGACPVERPFNNGEDQYQVAQGGHDGNNEITNGCQDGFDGILGIQHMAEGDAQANGSQHADHHQHDTQYQHEDGVQARADQVAFALVGGGDFFGRAIGFQHFQGHLLIHRFAGLLAALVQHILQDRADFRLDIAAGFLGQAASDFRHIVIDQVSIHSLSPSASKQLVHY